MNQIERSILVSVKNCYLHRACLGTITLVGFGALEISAIKHQQTQHIYITVGEFYYCLQKPENMVITETDSSITYYLLDGNKGLYAFTLCSRELQMINFEKTLQLSDVKLIKSEDIDQNPDVKNWIEQHRPTYKTENIVCPNMFKKFISKSGFYVNKKMESFENNVVDRIKKRSDTIISNMDRSRQEIKNENDENDGAFNKIKKGAGILYDKSCWLVSAVVNPLMKGIHKGSTKISDKIDKSNSNFLKRTKQFLSITELSLRNSVDGIKNSVTGIGSQLITEGKQIIALKMKPKAVVAEVPVEQNNRETVETSDMPINGKKEELVYYSNEPQVQYVPDVKAESLQFPKLPEIEISIQKQIEFEKKQETETEKSKFIYQDGILKVKNTLEQLSDHESVQEQTV